MGVVEYISVKMVREYNDKIPQRNLPAGYAIRPFAAGDKNIWASIETQAGEFKSRTAALTRFSTDYSLATDLLAQRMIFLTTESGKTVGTATAWYDPSFRDGEYGRLHWVAIVTEYEGLGLGKPLVGEAIKILGKLHSKMFLTTQTTSYKAISIYLDFGFEPLVDGPEHRRAWNLLAKLLHNPNLQM